MTALSEADATPAGIGHNNPPSLLETLKEVYGNEVAKVAPIADLANKQPPKIETVEARDAAAAIANDASTLAKALDKLRVVEKAPHLLACRNVDDFFGVETKRLDRITDAMLKRIDAFNCEVRRKADEERRQQEEEQRRIATAAREAADRAAAAGRTDDAVEDLKDAAAAEVAADEIALAPRANVDDQIKTDIGDTGASLGTRKDWTFEITDWDRLDLNKLRGVIKREHVEQALRAHVKLQKDTVKIDGVRFFQAEKATIRR